MSPARTFEVFRQEVAFNFRRPLFWVMVALLAFLAFMMSQGNASIQSGDSRVGGTKAWINSEFALAQLMILMTAVIYVFFVAVGAGMTMIRDRDQKVGELLHSTSLTPAEYVWGKYLGVLFSFAVVMFVHVGLTMACNHLLPHAENVDVFGPFNAGAYLRAALIWSLPMIVLFSGTCFALGALTGQPTLVFIGPVSVVLVGAFFLWDWSPAWLSPTVNRILQFVDFTGLRWMKEMYLLVDRGVDYYNHATVTLDGLMIAQRLLLLVVGLGSVWITQVRFAATLRGSKAAPGARKVAVASAAPASPGPAEAPAFLSALHMASGAPGFWRGAWEVARVELRELRSSPGLYLFVPLILLQVFGNDLTVGAFDTRLLLTAGTYASALMNTLTLLICMVILFYTTESLQRERSTGLGAIYYATPMRTASLLFGKALANTLLGIIIVFAALIGCLIMLAVQGKVPLDVRPFMIVWGLLLAPTFLMWTAFVSASFAVTGNRYGTYAIGLGAMILTGWFQMRDKMQWAFNWDLWSATRWSDITHYELDFVPLLLNRVMVLGLFVLFTVMTVRLFARRELDATRTVHRMRPSALFGSLAGLAPFALVPLACMTALVVMVHQGDDGALARKKFKDYWKKNVATYRDYPAPALAAVDADLDLTPSRREFGIQGTYHLVNPHAAPLEKVLLTGSPFWKDVRWTVNGDSAKPENRAGLYVFTPTHPLATGEGMTVGFRYTGAYPKGTSKNGAGRMEFILPSSIVLTSFDGPTLVPQLGFSREIGVEKDKNDTDPKEYADDYYKSVVPAGIGMAENWFDSHLKVTVPADLQVNATGILVGSEEKNGKRTTEWRTDHPVRIFNVIAGRWKEKRGEGVAVYYDAQHPYNVDEMLEALAGARKWYGEWFAPYPWKELRLSEFAALATYAQAPPTNITFSENIGFLTRSKPEANAAFWITAHEAAHQWWPNIAMSGQGPGGDILSEGMAHFSTILLTEQVKGLEQRMAFCKQIEDRYGNMRVKDSERPMVKVDGTLGADQRIIYDKGGWVLWMLFQHLGRERGLAALKDYLETYRDSRDNALLPDYLAVMRRHAADTTAFDAFARQWFYEVHVPQYLVTDATIAKHGSGWEVKATIQNIGSGRMSVPVAASRGTRFEKKPEKGREYVDARTTVTLDQGQIATVEIPCGFEADHLIVDPDVTVLMLERQKARVALAKPPAPGTVAVSLK